MAPLEKLRISEIDSQLKSLRAEHRRAVESWRTFHRLRLDIESLSKILEEEKNLLEQGQLMFPVEHSAVKSAG